MYLPDMRTHMKKSISRSFVLHSLTSGMLDNRAFYCRACPSLFLVCKNGQWQRSREASLELFDAVIFNTRRTQDNPHLTMHSKYASHRRVINVLFSPSHFFFIYLVGWKPTVMSAKRLTLSSVRAHLVPISSPVLALGNLLYDEDHEIRVSVSWKINFISRRSVCDFVHLSSTVL
jgi:hypothetical protein